MAINIFSGTTPKSSANAATNSNRSKRAQEALTTPAQVSSSGNTAVSSQNTLSKVGNFVGNVAGIASKFLPGVAGTIAKGVSNILNDPEWWQEVPGEGISLNEPLRLVSLGTIYSDSRAALLRVALVEFVSAAVHVSPGTPAAAKVMSVTDTQVTQYLMPEIRKVVNAVPLQEATSYGTVLAVNATLYALYRQLLKCNYLLEHGQTYLPSMNDVKFPILQVENASYLQSTINRLEEYLRANVRLPHTLCEYLSWRYGRVYKSNSAKKSGLVMYNVLTLQSSIEEITTFIRLLMEEISKDAATQKANTDIYNAYFDHDMQVEIRDDTQLAYDLKEFALRTNMDVMDTNTSINPVVLDSSLDNPTAFMASTVSAIWDNEVQPLFPVYAVRAYVPDPGYEGAHPEFRRRYYSLNIAAEGQVTNNTRAYLGYWTNAKIPVPYDPKNDDGLIDQPESKWFVQNLTPNSLSGNDPILFNGTYTKILTCKALDIYNAQHYQKFVGIGNTDQSDEYTSFMGKTYVDATCISADTGTITETVLQNEQVFAFANLVSITRKHSLSYKSAEKLVAKDTANLIDKLDVATAADTKPIK